MRKAGTSTRRKHRIFLSYAKSDEETALKIVRLLLKRGISEWTDAIELHASSSLSEIVRRQISANDYLVVLLSQNSVKSNWIQEEIDAAFLAELDSRNITLIPVIIADCKPPMVLRSYQSLDLRTNLSQGIKRLADLMRLAPEIDFATLDGKSFENLVVKLLESLGFSIETRRAAMDQGFDFRASYATVDPFGRRMQQTWLVEVKFYSNSKPNLHSIRELAYYLLSLSPKSKGLLVTNGHLTSISREWLDSVVSRNRIDFRVIDGAELRIILLHNVNLVEEYFGRSNREH